MAKFVPFTKSISSRPIVYVNPDNIEWFESATQTSTHIGLVSNVKIEVEGSLKEILAAIGKEDA
jgi:hypothetical protein